ncbi:uncharacterized protein [Halyomorpha halys]|uniref:uncharacterized protein isoform X2 n=1 Tax=Halyomorpha halys TaxID=286706 RepID=UPI0006D4D210|nr:uncharacterized protein LOC106685104 isoform X2 [Halyomorpha halys]
MTTICLQKFLPPKKKIMGSYSCLFCDSFLDSTFYMCSNLHICCYSCRLVGDCHVMQILCCSLTLYETSPKEPLFKAVGGIGPIISLPDTKLVGRELCLKCPSCESKDVMPSRLFNCPDCGRFLSNLWLVEHYQRDHPSTHVCPIPPGGCLSFKLKLNDIQIGKMKRLQVIKIIPSDWFSKCGEYNEQSEPEDKILFVMATKTYFFNMNTVMLLWLASCFQACLMTYTIEARGEKNNYATALYTGNPVGPKIMEELTKGTMKYEEIGQCLAVKDSLARVFENEGNGLVINILIYKDT